MHVAQTLTEQREAMQRSRPRIRRQIATIGQALGETDGFLDAIDDCELPVAELSDDHVKPV